ncbi:MAG: hypothetical protein ABL891_15280 [Burkholderiales bacterium]
MTLCVPQQIIKHVTLCWNARPVPSFWSSAVAVTARMTFMSKIIHGHGFIPMSPERAKAHAEQRAKAGYVGLYPQLRKNETLD